jgi:hypothetical protein
MTTKTEIRIGAAAVAFGYAVAVFLLFMIPSSHPILGPGATCFRMAVMVPLYWLGLVDDATARALVIR